MHTEAAIKTQQSGSPTSRANNLHPQLLMERPATVAVTWASEASQRTVCHGLLMKDGHQLALERGGYIDKQQHLTLAHLRHLIHSEAFFFFHTVRMLSLDEKIKERRICMLEILKTLPSNVNVQKHTQLKK